MDKLSDLERLEAVANNVSDYESSSDSDDDSASNEDNDDVEDTLKDDQDPRFESSAGEDIGISKSKQDISIDSVQIVAENHILEAIDTGQSDNDEVTDNIDATTDAQVYNETTVIEKDPLADNSNHAIDNDIPITIDTTSENLSATINVSSDRERDPLDDSLEDQEDEEEIEEEDVVEVPVTRNIESREDKRVGRQSRGQESKSDHNNKLVDLFLSVEPIVNMSRDLEEEDAQEEEEDEQDDDQGEAEEDNDEFEVQTVNQDRSPLGEDEDEEVILDEELDVMDPEEAAMLEEMVDDTCTLGSDDSSGEDDAGEDVDKIASDDEEEREEIDQEHTEEGDHDEDENIDDDDEDNLDEVGDDEDLEPNIENLLAQNTNYKDFLKNVLAELTTELQNNQSRQNELESLMQDKEQELRMITRKPTRHIAVVKKALTIFGFPYFKDVQMFYPPPNKDVLTKRKEKELDVYVEVPKLWNPVERRDMLNACRQEALYKRLHRLFDEKEELERQMKMIGVTDLEKEILEEKLRVVTFDLKTGSNISNAELFADRNYEYDWMAISKNLTGFHDPTECRLQWMNLVHPSINRAPWTFEEDELLKQLAEATDCREWDDIAAEIGSGRTAIACFKRFMQKHIPLNRVYCWSRKEDDRLKRLVEHTRIQFYIPWSKVHYYMPGRTKDQCNQRYMNSLRDGIRNGLWTESEEWVLIAGQTLYNGDNIKVSEILPTRSNMQIYCHWGNYMKGDYRPWSNEEDIILLEAVKKNGIKNWKAVADVFNDESRNRTRCRHRFEAIYRLFEKYPSTGLDNMIDLDTNKQAAKRRAAAYSSFEKKFESWAQRMNLEPVLTSIPVQHVDLNAKTKLPNGTVVQNRTLSRFIRHLQTLLPKLQPIKLDRPLAPILRRFPDQVVDPLPVKPKRPKKICLKRPKREKKPVVPIIRLERVHQVNKSSSKSIMDHKMTRLFRPAMLIPKINFKHRHDEIALATLIIATKNLDLALDFSSVKNNLDEEKICKFSRGEEQILERYRFHTDITDKQESPPSHNQNKSSRKARVTYRNKLKQTNTNSDDPQSKTTPVAVDRMNVLPANLATLRMLRGCLLHADYTATIARNIEKGSKWSFIQNNTIENKSKVLRHGIKNPDILARNMVGTTLFTPVSKATAEELEENAEQVIADRKLVERLVKLLFLPAKMSINTPENHQDLFDDLDELEEVNDTIDLDPSTEGSEQVLSPLPTDTSAVDMSTDNEHLHDNHDDITGGSASDQSSSSLLRIRKLSSLQEQPLNLSMNLSRSPSASTTDAADTNRSQSYANLPSVMVMSNPSTPATRTYSRKRKGTRLLNGSLVINFNQLLSSSQEKRSKKACKMTDIIRDTNKSNPSVPESSSSTPDSVNFSSMQSLGSDSSTAPEPSFCYVPDSDQYNQQRVVILPNIPAHITPVPVGTTQQIQVRPSAKPTLSVMRVHPGRSARSPFLPGQVVNRQVTSMPPPPAPQPLRLQGISEFLSPGPGPSGDMFQPAVGPVQVQPGPSSSGQPTVYRMPRMRLPSRNERFITPQQQQEISLQQMALQVAVAKAQQQNFAGRPQLPQLQQNLELGGPEQLANLQPNNTFFRLLMANSAQNMQQSFFQPNQFPPSQFPPSNSDNNFQ